MPFDFGDVVLMPFPFTDQSAAKRRPATVVSNREYAAARPDVIVMAITSQRRPSGAVGDCWIVHWQHAGLLKPSAVKPVLATIEQRLILRHLGALHGEDQTALRRAIAEIIG